jgi:tetratricopeptide (TPR) repeat protein
MKTQGEKRCRFSGVLMIAAGLVLGGFSLSPAQDMPVSNYEYGIFSSAKRDLDARDFAGAAATLGKYFDAHRHRHPYAYELYGHILLHTQQPAKALEVLQSGVEEYPDRLNLVQNLAVAHARMDQPVRAGATFLRAYALSGHQKPQLAFSAGVYLARGEQYDQAADIVGNLIRKEGLRPAWALFLAQCRLHLQQGEQAARLLEEAVELFPDNEELWRMLAFTYYRNETLKKAAAAFEVALTLGPSSTKESVQLATLFMNLGAANLGATTAKEASPAELDNIAYCLAKSGNLEQGLQKALEAWQKAPTDERRFRLAHILFRMNRLEEAASHYQALAHGEGPYQAKAQWALALLAWHAGDWATTHAQLNAMKQTDPQMRRRAARLLQIMENIMQQE